MGLRGLREGPSVFMCVSVSGEAGLGEDRWGSSFPSPKQMYVVGEVWHATEEGVGDGDGSGAT